MTTHLLEELKSLLCPECGSQLRPASNTLAGIYKVGKMRTIRYTHALGPVTCPHLHEVYEVEVPVIEAKLIGREDWNTLPPKLTLAK